MATSLGAARGSITIDTSDVKAAEGRVRTAAQNMNRALTAIGVGISLETARRLGEVTFALAESAAKAQVTRESFTSLAASVGESADFMLAAMQRASKGTISDVNLMLGANRALVSGVADSSAEITQLLEIARATSKTFGVGTADAFNRIVQSLAKLEPELIDELGVTVKLDQVFREYATTLGTTADKLTNAQRKTAFFNQVVKQTQKLVDANANAAETSADKFEQFAAKLENSKVKLGEFLLAAGGNEALDNFSAGMDDNVTQLQRLETWLGKVSDAFTKFAVADIGADNLRAFEDRVNAVSEAMARLGIALGTRGEGPRFNRAGISSSGSIGVGTSPGVPRSGLGAATEEVAPIDTAKLRDAQLDYASDLADINRQSAQEIADITRDGARQRADTIRQYELGIVREQEDFNRQRARSLRDYERSIVGILRDAQEREIDLREELDETIADARSDSSERIADLERNYNRDREDREADHKDRMLSAAGRLDAIALLEERKKFSRESKEQKEANDEAISKERENLDESIREAQEAHRERLEDARKADARRLADMRLDRALQQADEDEDRRIRKERDAADHIAQLAEHDRAQAERIAQTVRQAAEHRAALKTAFQEELLDLGLHNLAVEKERKRAHEAELKAIAPDMKDWFDTVRAAMEASSFGPKPLNPMISPGQWPSLLGGGGTATASTARTTTNSRTVNIAQITINGDGLNAQEVVDILIRELENN